jgi:hypothetical protein
MTAAEVAAIYYDAWRNKQEISTRCHSRATSS